MTQQTDKKLIPIIDFLDKLPCRGYCYAMPKADHETDLLPEIRLMKWASSKPMIMLLKRAYVLKLPDHRYAVLIKARTDQDTIPLECEGSKLYNSSLFKDLTVAIKVYRPKDKNFEKDCDIQEDYIFALVKPEPTIKRAVLKKQRDELAMGMFDYIKCEMPLPGTVPAAVLDDFQTKDTPDQELVTYTIREDKVLVGPDGVECRDFTGTIEFYASNICGFGPGGTNTRNGEDAESVTYRAVVLCGVVQSLEQTKYTIEPALPSSNQWPEPLDPVSEDEIEKRKLRQQESLAGREIYILWGHVEKGYRARVECENDWQLCVRVLEKDDRREAGQLEILRKNERDHTFFDSEEDALADRAKKELNYYLKRKNWLEYVAEWHKKRGTANPEQQD